MKGGLKGSNNVITSRDYTNTVANPLNEDSTLKHTYRISRQPWFERIRQHMYSTLTVVPSTLRLLMYLVSTLWIDRILLTFIPNCHFVLLLAVAISCSLYYQSGLDLVPIRLLKPHFLDEPPMHSGTSIALVTCITQISHLSQHV